MMDMRSNTVFFAFHGSILLSVKGGMANLVINSLYQGPIMIKIAHASQSDTLSKVWKQSQEIQSFWAFQV